jgi:hypothetical protein
MMTLQRPVEHAAVHRLACACGARCPDCGGRGTTLRALAADEEAADYAARLLRGRRLIIRRLRPGATARSLPAVSRTTNPNNPLLPSELRAQDLATLRAMRWSGWGLPANRTVTMQDLESFCRQGGVERVKPAGRRRGRPRQGSVAPAKRRRGRLRQSCVETAKEQRGRLKVSEEGQRLLRTSPFQHLEPIFRPPRGPNTPRDPNIPENIPQIIYAIVPADRYGIPPANRRLRPLYIGKTSRAPGLRLIEHLQKPRNAGQPARGLDGLRQLGRLGSVEVVTGAIGVPDLGRRSHQAEVLLQEIYNPAWNSPSRHGFED